jgi:DNA (cytosine-5)-methyltransferase 1
VICSTSERRLSTSVEDSWLGRSDPSERRLIIPTRVDSKKRFAPVRTATVMPPLTFYDFFAGVGMAEVGLAPEWSCVWANDFDPRKAATYCANHDPSRFVLGDIATVQPGHLPVPATMAWASFPCQDLSLAGWRRGMSPGGRSGTFWEFHRIMRGLHDHGLRPPIIVLENVVGLLS